MRMPGGHLLAAGSTAAKPQRDAFFLTYQKGKICVWIAWKIKPDFLRKFP